VPGLEGMGVVEATGEGASKFKPGQPRPLAVAVAAAARGALCIADPALLSGHSSSLATALAPRLPCRWRHS